jgi:hypothetical protein
LPDAHVCKFTDDYRVTGIKAMYNRCRVRFKC